jgi:hypothetical protein
MAMAIPAGPGYPQCFNDRQCGIHSPAGATWQQNGSNMYDVACCDKFACCAWFVQKMYDCCMWKIKRIAEKHKDYQP